MTLALRDMHALVWAATASHRLGDTERTLIEDPSTDLRVSATSAWELAAQAMLEHALLVSRDATFGELAGMEIGW